MLLSKSIEAKIEEAILSKTISPGSKLPSEQELCSQFGVSRTAIREALRMLSGRGLVTIVKGKGVFVKNPSAETVTNPMHLYLHLTYDRNYVLDVIHARQLIEPPIAAAAAKHHTAEDIEKLSHDLAELTAFKGDHGELSRLDMTFHLDIARASENPIIPLLLDPIHRLMPKIKTDVYSVIKNAHQSAIEWHTKVLKAILKRDEKEAFRMMQNHLKIAEEHIIKTYGCKK
ncbi:MAG: FadR/GntR family transcriptional regulator [bacterium]